MSPKQTNETRLVDKNRFAKVRMIITTDIYSRWHVCMIWPVVSILLSFHISDQRSEKNRFLWLTHLVFLFFLLCALFSWPHLLFFNFPLIEWFSVPCHSCEQLWWKLPCLLLLCWITGFTLYLWWFYTVAIVTLFLWSCFQVSQMLGTQPCVWMIFKTILIHYRKILIFILTSHFKMF